MQLRFPDFLEVHFGFHHFSRFFEGTLGERGLSFYLVALAGDAEPWILLLPLAAHRAWQAGDRRAAAVLPWALLVVTLAFFSLSSGKRNVYLLPLYPALAVVVAPVLEGLLDGRRPALARLAGIALAVAAAGAATFLVLFVRNEPRIAPEAWILVGILAALSALALVAGIAARGRLLVAGGLAGLSAGLLALALLLPAVGRLRPVPRMAAEIRRLEDRARPEPAVVYRARVTSLAFYLGRRTEKAADGASLEEVLAGAERAFVLVPERRRAHLEAEAPWLSFEEVHRAPHLDFHFSKNVLGRGPSTEDLLLLRATRRP
jgi:4-amino-4-deoxy-L-arabinose transferase-like glycosyltransferase